MGHRLEKKLRQELFERAPASAIGSCLLLGAFSLIVPQWVESTVALSMGGMIGLGNLLRLFIISRPDHPQLRPVYIACSLATAVGWGLLSTWAYLRFNFEGFENQAVLLIMSGIGASSLLSLAAAPLASRFFIALTIVLPISICVLHNQGRKELTFLGLFGFFAIFLWAQSRSLYRSLLERFQTALTLEEEHSILQTIVDTVPGYLSYIDKDLRYMVMNANLRRQLNISEADYVGKKVGFLHDMYDVVAKEIIQFALSDRDTLNREMELRIDNEYRWHMICLRKSDDRQWLVCVSINIHHEKMLQLEAEDQKAKVLASAKMAALGEMSSGIAHEINNPLAIISGKAHRIQRMIEKLPNFQESKEVEKDVQSVQNMVSRIAKIIRGLQTFARDGEKESFVETSVRSILEETLSLCQTRMKDAQVDLVLPSEITAAIQCRPTQLSQVFLNLLNNAFDAVKDCPVKRIQIEIEESSHELVIRINDSGAGIPIEIRDRIFQPFFTTKEVGKGTGLGLSISSGIIRAHGGSLELDSARAETCFVIRLPRSQAMTA